MNSLERLPIVGVTLIEKVENVTKKIANNPVKVDQDDLSMKKEEKERLLANITFAKNIFKTCLEELNKNPPYNLKGLSDHLMRLSNSLNSSFSGKISDICPNEYNELLSLKEKVYQKIFTLIQTE